MRYISSGHSHGEQITIILEGIPSNLPIDTGAINHELKRRQSGYGRGSRMMIEQDEAIIVGGVLFGKTTGAPISIIIKNKDYRHHEKYMHPLNYELDQYKEIKVPRPGHADLNGAIKYNFRDMRLVFERASARETVSIVVVGAICQHILELLDIHTLSYVKNIGGIDIEENIDLKVLDSSPVRMPNLLKSEEAMKKIDEAKLKKDTLGGICEVHAYNVPMGLGSFVSHDQKLDAKLASSLISIPSCKGVEFGDGFHLAHHFGSETHDEIIYDEGFSRKTNHYGGFEGGMTTGMPIIARCVFKPIPTLMQPLKSVNIETKEVVDSHIERSDVSVLPSASVICEHTLNYCLTESILSQFTSTTIEELKSEVKRYREYVKRF